MEFVKSTIEHCKTIIVGFFIKQYAKLQLLVLYDKLEELEIDTDSLYLALAEKVLDLVRILPSK